MSGKRFTPTDKNQLQNAIKEYYKLVFERNVTNYWEHNNGKGRMNEWDVSNITDMSYLFSYINNFNEDIGDWDVSNVTNMESMFSHCPSFNNNNSDSIKNWNVSNVTNMQFMFMDCTNFNQPLNDWDVSNVTNMKGMFTVCISFNQPLNDWNVSNVRNMFYMFRECTIFNQPLNKWHVDNVTNTGNMFAFCENFNQNLSSWDISNATDIGFMFHRSGMTNIEYLPLRLQPQSQPPQPPPQPQTRGISGLAFEIHDYFESLDKQEILSFLNDFNNNPSNVVNKMTEPNNSNNMFAPLETFIRNSNDFDENAKRYHLNTLNTIHTKIQEFYNSPYSDPLLVDKLKKLADASLLFATKQSDDFIEQYIKTFVDECALAYEGRVQEITCNKGAVERITTGIGKVASNFCLQPNDKCTVVMQKLKDLFNNVSLTELRNQWINEYIVVKSKELKEKNEAERKSHFIKYMTDSIPFRTEETDKQIKEMADRPYMIQIFKTGEKGQLSTTLNEVLIEWFDSVADSAELKKMSAHERKQDFIVYAKNFYDESMDEKEIVNYANQEKDDKGNEAYQHMVFTKFALYGGKQRKRKNTRCKKKMNLITKKKMRIKMKKITKTCKKQRRCCKKKTCKKK